MQFQRTQFFVENVGVDTVRLEVMQKRRVFEPVTTVFVLAQSAAHDNTY